MLELETLAINSNMMLLEAINEEDKWLVLIIKGYEIMKVHGFYVNFTLIKEN